MLNAEGIETVISAERPATGWLRSGCSTPEGIETVISWSIPSSPLLALPVLNARRHRDGDQTWR